MGAANVLGCWVGVLQESFSSAASRWGLCLEVGVPGLGERRGRSVLGHPFEMTQGPWVLGGVTGDPAWGWGPGPLAGPEHRACRSAQC